MRTPSLLLALASTVFLAACGSDSASDDPSLIGFEGSWAHYEDSTLRDHIHFVGGRLRHESFLRGCNTAVLVANWAYSAPILTLSPLLSWSRSHDENAVDSAAACIQEPDTATISGSHGVQLANVGASSFQILTHRTTTTENGTTDTVITELYVRQ